MKYILKGIKFKLNEGKKEISEIKIFGNEIIEKSHGLRRGTS